MAMRFLTGTLLFTIWKRGLETQNRKIDAMFSETPCSWSMFSFFSIFLPCFSWVSTGFNRLKNVFQPFQPDHKRRSHHSQKCRLCPATTPHPPWPQVAPSLLGLCPWAAHRTRVEAPRGRRPWVSPAESPGRYCAPRPHGMAGFNAWNIIGIFIVKGNHY